MVGLFPFSFPGMFRPELASGIVGHGWPSFKSFGHGWPVLLDLYVCVTVIGPFFFSCCVRGLLRCPLLGHTPSLVA